MGRCTSRPPRWAGADWPHLLTCHLASPQKHPQSWRLTQPIYQTEDYYSDDAPPGAGILSDVRNAFSAAATVQAPPDEGVGGGIGSKYVEEFQAQSRAAAMLDDTAGRVGRGKMDLPKGADV